MLNPYRRRAPLTPDSAANRFLWGSDETTLSLVNGPRSTLGAVARRARRGRAAGRLWGVTRGTSVARRRPSGDGPGRLSRGPRALAHGDEAGAQLRTGAADRKSTRLNSSHVASSYAVFCLKKKKRKMSKYIET